MSELKADSINWYFCKRKNLQIPVHISVHKLTSTTTSTTTTTSAMTTTTTAETLPTTPQHSSLLTSAETHTAQPTNPTINGTGGDSLQAEHKISTRAMILITSLTLSLFLLLLVPAAFFGWRMMRRRHATPEGAHIPADSQTGSDPDVHYATVVHNQHVAGQNKIEPAEGSVIYSTLQIKMQ
ncbi:salivary glue protein Sgs-3-like [Larimichthys crocea]|uniref:salivary glue protein Sgs-3-like n=1 Tax=Larimichthys crocea TaxID=215358 RepID=UPI000F5E4B3D|nr:salivary glue protein Sgs-3-like [Larimichthys crocea]